MPGAYDRVNVDGLRFEYERGEERLRDVLVDAAVARSRSRGDLWAGAHARPLRVARPAAANARAWADLTGQDVGTCGVMGALSGAIATASTMLRRNLFSEMSKAA